MKRFEAYDDYNFHELLCESDNLMDCYNTCVQRFEDTDGECDCDIKDMETIDSYYIGIYGRNGWNDEE